MREIELVLAATDCSERGAWAVATGAALAQRAGAALEVVSVVEPLPLVDSFVPPGGEAAVYFDAFAERARHRAEAQARDAAFANAPIHVLEGPAAPLVADLARELAADILVVGAHPEPAIARSLIGSTAERIIHFSACPVLVAHGSRRDPFSRVLAALDLSSQSRAVLEVAAAIAVIDHGELRALYVDEPIHPMIDELELFDEDVFRRTAHSRFEQIVAATKLPSGVELDSRKREGRAGSEILKEGREWEAELIVMGTHGLGFFEGLILGSTSRHVLRHGDRSVLVVPRDRQSGAHNGYAGAAHLAEPNCGGGGSCRSLLPLIA